MATIPEALAAAVEHQRAGRLDAAEEIYRQILAADSNQAAAHHNLGILLRQKGLWEEAIACLRRAIELQPLLAQAHDNLGTAFTERKKLDEAVACYRRAIELKPDFAEAHNGLGTALRKQGKLDEAIACYRRAIELKPDFAEAHARLANMLRGKLPEVNRSSLEQCLANPQLDRPSRADLSFALAQVMDARGEYDRAADLLRHANALRLEFHGGERAYLSSDHEKLVDGLIHAFDREFFERVRGAGLETRRPVFVVGLPRSGTTLVEQVLASHSQVHGGDELTVVQETFASLPTMLGRGATALECVAHLDARALERLAEEHLRRLAAVDGGGSPRIVDKLPENYLYLGFIAALFPRATVIHCRRNLRDVAVSCWMTDFASILWSNDFGHLAGRFRQYLRVMDHWRETLPVTIHEVDYEQMVAELEPHARRLVAACGLDWEPACLEYYRTERPIHTASGTQVRQPIYTRSVGRWKHYERALAELFDGLPSQAAR